MSRGLGELQRGVIKALDAEQRVLILMQIAGAIYGARFISRSEYEAMRRAVHACQHRGLITSFGWIHGRRAWGMPAVVDAHMRALRERYQRVSVASAASAADATHTLPKPVANDADAMLNHDHGKAP